MSYYTVNLHLTPETCTNGLFIICVIVYNLYYCCYAKTSSPAVQILHSNVYGNPIAPSLYSILLGISYTHGNKRNQVDVDFNNISHAGGALLMLYQLKPCKRKQAESGFLSAFYRLSDLYGTLLEVLKSLQRCKVIHVKLK